MSRPLHAAFTQMREDRKKHSIVYISLRQEKIADINLQCQQPALDHYKYQSFERCSISAAWHAPLIRQTATGSCDGSVFNRND